MAKRGTKSIDMTGQRFGRLLVISQAPNYVSPHGKTQARWHCQCDCGKSVIVNRGSLRTDTTKSCGCYLDEVRRQRAYKHGRSTSKLYDVWTAMKQRTLNPNDASFHKYGGRGIKICDEWRDSFQAFADHMGERPSAEHSIERVDNNGPYSPENVAWATHAEQSRNKRDNVMIEHNNRRMCLAEWSREFGIPRTTLEYRIFVAKWSIEKALTEPNPQFLTLTYNGHTMSLRSWAKELGLPYSTLHNRILKLQWPLHRALKNDKTISDKNS